jgi:ABC-type cobalamin/Fe3+-siderophores transport system ATPase subunit
MTPEAVVTVAIAEGLEVIALTDHNSSTNVARAVEAAAKVGNLLVIPAVEVSTSQGHLLLYFPTVERLDEALGKLTFATGRAYCTQSFEDCLEIARLHGGLGIAAHIEAESGFLQRVPGNTPAKGGIVKHPALAALEILNLASMDAYTDSDADPARRQHAKERREALELTEDLPKVMSSDAHSLAKLGRNAADARRVTRLKMDELSFEAFRVALLEGSVRCRLEDLIPFKVPRLVGVSFQGGMLDGQAIHFSSNLTCIIGGRGSGKSTVLESAKAASGNETASALVDCETWSDTITLWHEDELGVVRQFVRQKGASPHNPEDEYEECLFPLEAYGQGETAETIQHCGDDPGLLLRFLDRLINFDDAELKDKDAVQALAANAAEIAGLATAVNSLPRYRQLRVEAEKKLKILEAEKAAEIIKQEVALAQERRYFRELDALLDELRPPKAIEPPGFLTYLDGIQLSTVAVGKDDLEQIIADAKGLREQLTERHKSWRDYVAEFVQRAKASLDGWKKKEAAEQAAIDEKRRALDATGIKLDIEFIRGLAKSKADYDAKVRELEAKDKKLRGLRESRNKLMEHRRSIRAQVYAKRLEFATKMNQSLGSEQEYRVTLKFREGAYSSDAETIVAGAMNWKTSRVPRAKLLVQQVTVPGILDAIATGDASRFEKVLDEHGIEVFNAPDRELLHQTLSKEDVCARLQACRYQDLPDITVQKSAPKPDDPTRVVVRKFSKLSLGQQQAVVLSILLHSESKAPLIIDQPEDNLDGEFVARILVPHLRRAKERRQVIVATHNANITVLADTELIVPLFAENEQARVYKAGSIDTHDTREQICRIVEGGKDSFVRRARIYGLAH